MFRPLRPLITVAVVSLAGCAGGGGSDDLVDEDHDGFAADAPTEALRDCDDRPGHGEQINPGAAERCDGLDNDCNGEIDEDGALGAFEWWPDADGDGFGINVEEPRVACSLPKGFAANHKDCNDKDPATFPQALERCNGVDDNCDLQADEGFDPTADWHADLDEDGYGAPAIVGHGCATEPTWVRDAADCNDVNRYVNPEAVEICNQVDDDCDGMIDGLDTDDIDILIGARTWYPDVDGDGFGSFVSPYQDQYLIGAVRSCPDAPPADFFVTNSGDCNDLDPAQSPASVWHRDADHDRHGDPLVTWPTQQCRQPVGYVLGADDCNDAQAEEWGDRLWYADADRDGYGFGLVPVWEGCRPANLPTDAWSADPGDCDDRSPGVHPGAVEVCSVQGPEIDEDCDGVAGDADPSATGKTHWFFDHDRDQFGISFGGVDACVKPDGYAAVDGDCDDNDAQRSPDAVWYVDADRDGYGDPATPSPTLSCDVVPGHVPNADDCNDSDYAQNAHARWWTDADGDDVGVGLTPAATGCLPSLEGLASWTGDCDDTDPADDAGGCFGPQLGTLDLVIHADRDALLSLVTYGCLDPVDDVALIPRRQYQIQASDRGRTITFTLGPLPTNSRCQVTVKSNGGDLSADGPLRAELSSCGLVLATVAGDLGVPAQPVDSPVVLVEHCSGCVDPVAENFDPTVLVPLPNADVCIYP